MKCPHCQAENDGDSKYCKSCGTRFNSDAFLAPNKPTRLRRPRSHQNFPEVCAGPEKNRNIYVENHLALAIISTLCCCIPLGIPAIVYASKVNQYAKMGDISEARRASGNAKLFAMLAIGLGFIIGILNILIVILQTALEQGNIPL